MAPGESGGRTSPSKRRSAEEEEGGEVVLLPLESTVRGDVTFLATVRPIPGLCVGVCAAKMSAATESSFRLALKKPPALRTTEVNKTIFPHRASFLVR